MADIVLKLPEDLRGELKSPMGPIYTDTQTLLSDAGAPVIAIGDVVTHHLIESGRSPTIALVDEHTERSAVSDDIAETIDSFEGFDTVEQVTNPAATLSADLLGALRAALDRDGSTLLDVDGEEDLAALPAVVAAPDGAAIVYGQPGEGMVLVTLDDETRTRCRDILARMGGDTDRLWSLLGVDT
jgi:uncharacterized protein (UPF0218 family)